MTKDTQPSTRSAQTLTATINKGSGFIKARRETILQGPSVSVIDPVPQARVALLRNTTPTNEVIRLNFGGSPVVPHYWELKTTDQPIEIKIDDSTILNAKCIGAVGELQIIYQG